MATPSENRLWCVRLRRLLGQGQLRQISVSQQPDIDAYGKGYAAGDTRELEPALSKALKDPTGQMISAADWDACAPRFDVGQRQALLAKAAGMQQRLQTLAGARVTERQLDAELATAKQAVMPTDEARKLLSSLKAGPPTFALGAGVGIPSSQFEAQRSAALEKWAAIYDAVEALKAIKPDSAERRDAVHRAQDWVDYWQEVLVALEAAEAKGFAGVDLHTLARPTEQPELTKFPEANKHVQPLTGGKSPYSAPVQAPATIAPDQLESEKNAAIQKAALMLDFIQKLQQITQRSPAQEAAMQSAQEWHHYWGQIKAGLEAASGTDFNPASVARPAAMPDLDKLAGSSAVRAIYREIGNATGAASPEHPAPDVVMADQYQAQSQAAEAKCVMMRKAVMRLEAVQPATSEITAAKNAFILWRTYWTVIRDTLDEAAMDEPPRPSCNFAGLAKPPPLPPDVMALAGQPAAGDAKSPLRPCAVRASMISAADFDTAREAANAKATALAEVQEKFAGLANPTPKQIDTLSLVEAWQLYWTAIDAGLTDAEAKGLAEFDPNAIVAPPAQPDLALRAERTALNNAQRSRDTHVAEHCVPVENDIKECLPLLDSAANNPERIEVGAVLKALENLNGQALNAKAATLAKSKLLAELERTLFAWNDRRARQNLPPSAEAVAMADLHQREHRKLIDQLVKDDQPLPVHDVDAMDADEEAAMQASWKRLVEGTGNIKVPSQLDGAKTHAGANKTEGEAQQFRSETLANMARLLATSSGRALLRKLEVGNQPLVFDAASSPECGQIAGGRGKALPRLPANMGTEAEAKAGRGSGAGSLVQVVRGAKDSDAAARNEQGAQLHTPAFIAMGHEMIHALHNARGINRRYVNLPDGADPIWNNTEELRTISTGKLSEQVLRAHSGLSGVRFGHLDKPADGGVAESIIAALQAAQAMDGPAGEKAHETLRERGFTAPEMLTEATRLALVKADPAVHGPLPSGWDANELSIEQMRTILKHKLPADLKRLGWSPFDLAPEGSGDSIEAVIMAGRAHPKSPDGLHYDKLGGDAALQALNDFYASTQVKLADWSDEHWPSKPAALALAQSWLTSYGVEKGGEIAVLVQSKGKLTTKLRSLLKVLGDKSTELSLDPVHQQAQTFSAAGGMPAMERMRQLNMLLGTTLPAAQADLATMNAALQKADAWLDALLKAMTTREELPTDSISAILRSSLGSRSPLADKLNELLRCCRRARKVEPDFLAADLAEASHALSAG